MIIGATFAIYSLQYVQKYEGYVQKYEGKELFSLSLLSVVCCPSIRTVAKQRLSMIIKCLTVAAAAAKKRIIFWLAYVG